MLDQLSLDFDPASLIALNVVLGLVMYGVALDLTVGDFRRVIAEPRAAIVGLVSQLVLLPALTFALTLVLDPAPSLALGMILVAACPGGNMSNFFTHLSRGNTGLSITMTSIVTISAAVVTPLNISLWGGLNPETRLLLREVHLDPAQMAGVVGLILVLPIALGMLTRARWPELAAKLRRPFKIGSLVAFALFIVIALAKNFDQFLNYVHLVLLLVLVHNGLALLLGYSVGTGSGLSDRDRRAITIEVGIQNSGLGLVLIFNFFGGQGGMALVAAWWGVWHLVSGLTLGWWWNRHPPEPTQAQATSTSRGPS